MDAGKSADLVRGASTLVGAYGALKQGYSDKGAYSAAAKNTLAESQYQNAILDKYGKAAQATAQRGAIEQNRQANLAISRAVAVAAGSGAGASDPTITKLVGNIAGRGQYNALTSLYNGDSEADYYKSVATANTYNANAQAAGYKFRGSTGPAWDQAAGTILSGASSFLKKYGESDDDTDTAYTGGYTSQASRNGY